jgi:LacI family transcriptional regulator
MARVTLKELSGIANLSANTISRALNGKPGVNSETRKYILDLAKKHNYFPNMAARSMRGIKNNMIGTLVGDLTDPFFVELLAGVEEEATKHSMQLMIGNTAELAEKQRSLLNAFISYNCKNIIITPVNNDKRILNYLHHEGINFVIADRIVEGAEKYDQVAINNYGDSFRAVDYLLRHGHRDIMMVNQRSGILTETDRTKGYLNALAQNGIKPRREYIKLIPMKHKHFSLVNDLKKMKKMPSALFIAKDTLALDTVSSLYEAGLTIPNDISIILYGSPEWSRRLKPVLSCMLRPVREIGRSAVKVLLEKTRAFHPLPPAHILLDSILQEQDSIRDFRRII